MAKFLDIPASVLFEGGSRILWTDLDNTVTKIEISSVDNKRGSVIRVDKDGRELWRKVVFDGDYAYRVGLNGIRRMPMIENDLDTPRRLARTLGWPLTRIVVLKKDEVFTYSPSHQENNGKFSLSEGENIRVITFRTTGNTETETRIFIRKGYTPSWEDAQLALRRFATSPGAALVTFDEAVAKCRIE